MTIAQTKAARRRGNNYRRQFGPHARDIEKSRRRLAEKIAGERVRAMRKKGH